MGQLVIKDRTVLFDDADASLVERYQWHLHPTGKACYVRGYSKEIPRKEAKLIYMHRLILGAEAGDVDHIDGNGLDNRRCNLRACSRSLNNANRKWAASATGVKGVHFENWSGKWRAEIQYQRKRFKLGRYETQEAAAAAYRAKATELFGAFATMAYASSK